MSSPVRVRLGVSSCLRGENVRYDGGHKHHALIKEGLDPLVEWIHVCPEVEVGLGTPREPIQLVAAPSQWNEPQSNEPGEPSPPELWTRETRVDLTDRMLDYARERVEPLAELPIHGYVFKARSPSCGPQNVPVHDRSGRPIGHDVGLFVRVLLERLPSLPIVSEEDVDDPSRRLCFLERAFARLRLAELIGQPSTIAEFHAVYGDVVKRRDEAGEGNRSQELERATLSATTEPSERAQRYARIFESALREKAAVDVAERNIATLSGRPNDAVGPVTE